jgi:hypothetical protein
MRIKKRLNIGSNRSLAHTKHGSIEPCFGDAGKRQKLTRCLIKNRIFAQTIPNPIMSFNLLNGCSCV